MKPFERKKLEKELYDIANEIVGNVGPDIDNAFINTRKKEIVFFCLHRGTPVYSEIVDVWTKWVRAYCVFKKLCFEEATVLAEDPDLVVNWLSAPSIDVNGWPDYSIENSTDREWETGKKPDMESPKFVIIRASLVISRLDYNAT